MSTPLDALGWQSFSSPRIAAWARAALPLAEAALTAEPRRHGGTWAVGLDLLPNAPDGSVAGVPLPWQDFGLAPLPLHRAQISAVYSGYPARDTDETDSAHAFRRNRDAAHLDGLLALGPDKRRYMKEPHAWILGLPLTPPHGAPLVIWEGSHLLIRRAILAALRPHPPETWGDIDLTEPYAAARREVFATCRRIPLPQSPGEAVLLHRLTLHGVAPWESPATAPRIIAYFRPLLPSVEAWATAD